MSGSYPPGTDESRFDRAAAFEDEECGTCSILVRVPMMWLNPSGLAAGIGYCPYQKDYTGIHDAACEGWKP